nr:hypothetical protein [Tanacetum cinerariifolium]
MESVKKSINKRALHKREYDTRVNEREMQTTEGKVDTCKALDASLVNTTSSGTESVEQDTSSKLRNDAHADADIRPIYNEEPTAEVQLIADHNVFDTGQQHTKQPKFNNEGEIDHNAKQCHDTHPLPAILTDKQITELLNQYLKSENIFTTHYLPKERESAVVKPHHVITSSEPRNSSKNMPRFSSNNMVHNHYIEEAKKKIQERDRNLRPSKCVFNVNHDACVTKFLNEVNSRAKVPSNKTMNRNKLVEQTSFTKKLERLIPKGHRFSIKKTSVVHEKTTTPRSCLRWKLTGKIFKTVGLRRSYALSWKPYQGDSLNLPDHRYKRRCWSLILAESNSLPHAHAQTTKTYYKRQDSRIKKAQVLKIKTFANYDIKDPSSETKLKGRLLVSFQDDAKYEHVGQDTRSLESPHWPEQVITDHKLTHLGAEFTLEPLYPEVHPLSQEISDEVFHTKGDLMKSIQTFLEEFNCIPFEEKATILLQAWFKFFAIKHDQPKDSNELFQKLLEDLKELAEYKESLKNSSNETASNSNREKEGPPQDFDIRQLIREECCIEVCEEQKQNMEDTILELVDICRQKELLCMHDNEVKNVVEQSAKCGNPSIESLHNFRVIHKSSISLKNTSQISPVHAVAPILSTKEPEYSPSMGYEHSNTTLETELDEIIKSGVEELILILSENEVTLEDKRECDVPVCENFPICDDHYDIFSDSNNDDDISSDDGDFEEIEYVEASLSDPETVSKEEENVVYQEEEEFNLEDISQIQDVDRLSTFEESNNSLSDNFSPEFETFCDHTEETRSGNTTTNVDNSLPVYDSFCFEIEPDQERLINVMKNDISDDSSNDPLLEETDLFLASDNSIPPGIENFGNDSEGDIHFLEALLINDSILSHESFDSNFENNPSFPRPLPKSPDFELDEGEEILVVMNTIDVLEYFNPKDELDDDDYSSSCLLSVPRCFFLFSLLRVRTPSLTLVSPFRSSGTSLGWNFHVLSCLS